MNSAIFASTIAKDEQQKKRGKQITLKVKAPDGATLRIKAYEGEGKEAWDRRVDDALAHYKYTNSTSDRFIPEGHTPNSGEPRQGIRHARKGEDKQFEQDVLKAIKAGAKPFAAAQPQGGKNFVLDALDKIEAGDENIKSTVANPAASSQMQKPKAPERVPLAKRYVPPAQNPVFPGEAKRTVQEALARGDITPEQATAMMRDPMERGAQESLVGLIQSMSKPKATPNLNVFSEGNEGLAVSSTSPRVRAKNDALGNLVQFYTDTIPVAIGKAVDSLTFGYNSWAMGKALGVTPEAAHTIMGNTVATAAELFFSGGSATVAKMGARAASKYMVKELTEVELKKGISAAYRLWGKENVDNLIAAQVRSFGGAKSELYDTLAKHALSGQATANTARLAQQMNTIGRATDAAGIGLAATVGAQVFSDPNSAPESKAFFTLIALLGGGVAARKFVQAVVPKLKRAASIVKPGILNEVSQTAEAAAEKAGFEKRWSSFVNAARASGIPDDEIARLEAALNPLIEDTAKGGESLNWASVDKVRSESGEILSRTASGGYFPAASAESLIQLVQNAATSETVIHELAHAWHRSLVKRAGTNDAVADYVLKHFGDPLDATTKSDTAVASRISSEDFAEATTKFLLRGGVSNMAYKPLFEAVAISLKESMEKVGRYSELPTVVKNRINKIYKNPSKESLDLLKRFSEDGIPAAGAARGAAEAPEANPTTQKRARARKSSEAAAETIEIMDDVAAGNPKPKRARKPKSSGSISDDIAKAADDIENGAQRPLFMDEEPSIVLRAIKDTFKGARSITKALNTFINEGIAHADAILKTDEAYLDMVRASDQAGREAESISRRIVNGEDGLDEALAAAIENKTAAQAVADSYRAAIVIDAFPEWAESKIGHRVEVAQVEALGVSQSRLGDIAERLNIDFQPKKVPGTHWLDLEPVLPRFNKATGRFMRGAVWSPSELAGVMRYIGGLTADIEALQAKSLNSYLDDAMMDELSDLRGRLNEALAATWENGSLAGRALAARKMMTAWKMFTNSELMIEAMQAKFGSSLKDVHISQLERMAKDAKRMMNIINMDVELSDAMSKARLSDAIKVIADMSISDDIFGASIQASHGLMMDSIFPPAVVMQLRLWAVDIIKNMKPSQRTMENVMDALEERFFADGEFLGKKYAGQEGLIVEFNKVVRSVVEDASANVLKLSGGDKHTLLVAQQIKDGLKRAGVESESSAMKAADELDEVSDDLRARFNQALDEVNTARANEAKVAEDVKAQAKATSVDQAKADIKAKSNATRERAEVKKDLEAAVKLITEAIKDKRVRAEDVTDTVMKAGMRALQKITNDVQAVADIYDSWVGSSKAAVKIDKQIDLVKGTIAGLEAAIKEGFDLKAQVVALKRELRTLERQERKLAKMQKKLTDRVMVRGQRRYIIRDADGNPVLNPDGTPKYEYRGKIRTNIRGVLELEKAREGLKIEHREARIAELMDIEASLKARGVQPDEALKNLRSKRASLDEEIIEVEESVQAEALRQQIEKLQTILDDPDSIGATKRASPQRRVSQEIVELNKQKAQLKREIEKVRRENSGEAEAARIAALEKQEAKARVRLEELKRKKAELEDLVANPDKISTARPPKATSPDTEAKAVARDIQKLEREVESIRQEKSGEAAAKRKAADDKLVAEIEAKIAKIDQAIETKTVIKKEPRASRPVSPEVANARRRLKAIQDEYNHMQRELEKSGGEKAADWFTNWKLVEPVARVSDAIGNMGWLAKDATQGLFLEAVTGGAHQAYIKTALKEDGKLRTMLKVFRENEEYKTWLQDDRYSTGRKMGGRIAALSDVPGRWYAYYGSLYDYGAYSGRKMGLSGSELQAHIEATMKAPPLDVDAMAHAEMLHLTWNTDNKVTTGASDHIKRIKAAAADKSRAVRVVADLYVFGVRSTTRFIRVLTNLMIDRISHTPAALPVSFNIREELKKLKGIDFNEESGAIEFGEVKKWGRVTSNAMTGTALMAVGYYFGPQLLEYMPWIFGDEKVEVQKSGSIKRVAMESWQLDLMRQISPMMAPLLYGIGLRTINDVPTIDKGESGGLTARDKAVLRAEFGAKLMTSSTITTLADLVYELSAYWSPKAGGAFIAAQMPGPISGGAKVLDNYNSGIGFPGALIKRPPDRIKSQESFTDMIVTPIQSVVPGWREQLEKREWSPITDAVTNGRGRGRGQNRGRGR